MPDNEEQLYPYALTTPQRVKTMVDKLGSDMDLLITRLINSATDFIEEQCNGRRFVLTQYINDVSSTYGSKQKVLILRQCPVFYLVINGDTVAGSKVISNCSAVLSYGSGSGSSIVNIQPGMVIMWGDDGSSLGTPRVAIRQGQPQITVASVTANSITMSEAATQTINNANFLVHGFINAQYRAGTPSTPGWTNFILDQYELINNGQSGVVRVYGSIPRLYNNMIRATYWAGYVVDFDNAGNPALHTLPASLSYLCEKLVIRFITRRDFAGKNAETLSGATINFKDGLDKEDLMTIGQYRRVPNQM